MILSFAISVCARSPQEFLTFGHMSFIDIIIGIPLLWALYRGFTKGLIIEIASFVGFWIGIWGSIHFSNYLVPVLKEHFHIEASYLPIAAFFLMFLLIMLLIYLLAKLIQKAVEGMALGIFNKLGGAVFSVLKYSLIISVVIFILENIQKHDTILSSEQKKESVLYPAIGKIAPFIIPKLTELKPENIKEPLFDTLKKEF